MRASLAPQERVIFNADRPFVYIIRDNATGAALFIGRYALSRHIGKDCDEQIYENDAKNDNSYIKMPFFPIYLYIILFFSRQNESPFICIYENIVPFLRKSYNMCFCRTLFSAPGPCMPRHSLGHTSHI